MERLIRSGSPHRAGAKVEASQQPAPGGRERLRCAGDRAKRPRRGYTLVEIVIVMTIISILVSIAVPIYQKVVLRSKESVLRNNLFTMRTVIDEYTYDKQKAPQSLDDLVQAGYLRQVPEDPITNSNQTWKVIMEDSLTSVNQTEPGIFDVRSGSDKTSLEGTPYSEW
jgi:general secretion pathway protein G